MNLTKVDSMWSEWALTLTWYAEQQTAEIVFFSLWGNHLPITAPTQGSAKPLKDIKYNICLLKHFRNNPVKVYWKVKRRIDSLWEKKLYIQQNIVRSRVGKVIRLSFMTTKQSSLWTILQGTV